MWERDKDPKQETGEEGVNDMFVWLKEREKSSGEKADGFGFLSACVFINGQNLKIKMSLHFTQSCLFLKHLQVIRRTLELGF